jgi:hypothetical protein
MIGFLWTIMALAYAATVLALVISLTGALSTAGFIMIPLWAILGTIAGSAAELLTILRKPRA